MLDVFNIAKPQNCDIQMFFGDAGAASAFRFEKTWTKPRGVSHVYILLIGAGANGVAGNNGGGSGAVTVWYGAAQNVPDSLTIKAAGEGQMYDTTVSVRCISGTATTLLSATAAINATGAAAAAATPFAASGFYESVAGQNGTTNQTASATTFLSGGAQSTSNDVVANYGYQTTENNNSVGFFLLQPIIVGVGGGGNRKGGIGCGGGGATSGGVGLGGPGFVLIASW